MFVAGLGRLGARDLDVLAQVERPSSPDIHRGSRDEHTIVPSDIEVDVHLFLARSISPELDGIPHRSLNHFTHLSTPTPRTDPFTTESQPCPLPGGDGGDLTEANRKPPYAIVRG